MSIGDFIKEHKVGVAVGLAAIVGLYILSSKGTSAPTGDAQATLDAQSQAANYGTQLQIAQIQAQAQGASITAQQNVAMAQVSGSVQEADFTHQDTLAAISAQQTIQTQANALSAQTTQAVSLLQAQVAENTTAAQVEQSRINANAYVDIASLPFMNLNATQTAQLNSLSGNVQALSGDVTTIQNFDTAINASNTKNANDIISSVNYTKDLQASIGAGAPLASYDGSNPRLGTSPYNISGL